jgi:acyl carrier protein
MEALTFGEFVEFIRQWAHIPKRNQINPDTQFERDLGITGDDGSDLLIATEKKFGVKLSSETFSLEPNEYLFNSEGFGVVHGIMTLFNTPTVRAFTVGELYEAVDNTLKLEGQSD